MQCFIDCRVDSRLANDFLNMSLWGKPCYQHVLEAVQESNCFDHIHIVTDSQKIKEYCCATVSVIDVWPDNIDEKTMFISGRAPLITAKTIKAAMECGGVLQSQ